MGTDRPKCPCHGEPMTKNGHNPGGPQRWVCSHFRRQRSRDDYWKRGQRQILLAQYQARKEEGVCVRCRGPLTTSALCWDCLNEQEERHALRL